MHMYAARSMSLDCQQSSAVGCRATFRGGLQQGDKRLMWVIRGRAAASVSKSHHRFEQGEAGMGRPMKVKYF